MSTNPSPNPKVKAKAVELSRNQRKRWTEAALKEIEFKEKILKAIPAELPPPFSIEEQLESRMQHYQDLDNSSLKAYDLDPDLDLDNSSLDALPTGHSLNNLSIVVT